MIGEAEENDQDHCNFPDYSLALQGLHDRQEERHKRETFYFKGLRSMLGSRAVLQSRMRAEGLRGFPFLKFLVAFRALLMSILPILRRLRRSLVLRVRAFLLRALWGNETQGSGKEEAMP